MDGISNLNELRQAVEGKSGEVRLTCPFPDCTGSQADTLSVNAETGKWHCFRCERSGNIYKYGGNGGGEKPLPKFLWDNATPCTEHPYLSKKGVKSYGLRKDKHGNLLVPLYIGGHLSTIQFISESGEKRLLSKGKGGVKKGAYFQVGQGNGGDIYICEGYATAASVYEATGETVFMAVDAGNLLPVTENLKQTRPDKTFVFCADNDEHGKGQQKAAEAARIVGGKVCTPEQVGYDFNDLHQASGLDAVRERIRAAKKPDLEANPFKEKVILADALEAGFLASLNMTWRIDGVLHEGALFNGIYGPPGSYKSFIALDMALSISSGVEWQGREVKQASVAYVAAEGQYGLLKRIKAWKVHHAISDIGNFALYPIPALLDDPGSFHQFLEAFKELPVLPEVLFIDTLARSMVGDENQSLDIGRVVRACGRLSQETGAQVNFIHHTGKDHRKGLRGSLALEGATDSLISIAKSGDMQATVKNERQKDHEPFQDMILAMETVDTGYVTAGQEPVKSLVPVFDREAMRGLKEAGPGALKGQSKIALQALREALDAHGIKPTEAVKERMENDPIAQCGFIVHEDHWRNIAYRMGISDGSADNKSKAFRRARTKLIELGKVECWEDHYWIK